MGLAEDIAVIAKQESMLRWPDFDQTVGVRLGEVLRDLVTQERKGGCTMEVEIGGKIVFSATTDGAAPSQANWVRRKRNTVLRWQRSSYGVGRILDRDKTTLTERYGLADADYSAHGGGFPILVDNRGCVGTVVLSGFPQRDDHDLVVEAIARALDVDVPRLRAEAVPVETTAVEATPVDAPPVQAPLVEATAVVITLDAA